MGGGLRGWCLIVVLLVASRADAQAGTRVAIDWHGVSDRDIERCGLSRLRAGVIERLVSDGYALVERVDGSGVRVVVASSAQGIRIGVSAAEIAREDELRAGEPCDATFALDVIARIAELVDEVAAAILPAPAPVPDERSALEVAPQPEVDGAPRFVGAIDATVRASQAFSWLAGAGVSAGIRLDSGLSVGARVELAASAHLDVSVIELSPALTATYRSGKALLAPCFELGPVVHLANSDARSVAELDASLGAGLSLSTGHFLAQLLAYARLRDFEHRVGGEIAHDSGRVGLALRIGAQL